jgi:hypothetical protein
MTTPATPEQDAARLRLRRWYMLRLAGSGVFIVLVVVGLILGASVQGSPIGVILIGVGCVFRIMVSALGWYLRRRIRELTYLAQGRPRWWYARDTGEVEEGMEPRGLRRDGPYSTRDEALRAPEIARQRAAAWNAEDD